MDAPETGPAGNASPEAVAEPTQRPEARGIRFDPATLHTGDSVGSMVADSIVARRTIIDSTHVGMARFRGRIELSGRTIPHFDADLRLESVCFEADPASAARLPRWLHDERRPWFCFSNPAESSRALGPPGSTLDATIVIDELVIQRGLSDEVNSARFVERIGPEPVRP